MSETSELVAVSRALHRAVSRLRFGRPVTHVYDPLGYARETHEAYLSRWGRGPKEAVLVGMNPGPFGMAQTGVPFGDPGLVRSFVGVDGRVGRPPKEHPKRRIVGFASERAEVSGTRLWGFARDRFGTADAFFERFFVLNYCPLVFMEESGKNRTPDRLPEKEREPLEAACDRALRRAIEALAPRFVVGVGAFARKRCELALAGLPVTIGEMLHPSPASPKANRGWAGFAAADLAKLGIAVPVAPIL